MSVRSKQIIQWVIFGFVGLFVLGALAVTYSAVATPGGAWCHDGKTFVADTQETAHAEVGCAECHVETTIPGRAAFGARQVFHMTLRVVPEVDRSYASVSNERCLSCHEPIDGPAVVGSRGLRIKHQSCATGRECVECHSTTGHGASTRWPRVSSMTECFTCHGESNKLTGCNTCHEDRGETERIEAGTFRVTHGPQWKSTHGMGDMLTCDSCHTAAKCSTCHGAGVPHEAGFQKTHAKFSMQKDAKCTTCHQKKFCNDCHTYPMPHSTKFTIEHSKTVEKDGAQRCYTCHSETDCVQCHVEHVHPVTKEQMSGFMLRVPGAGE